MCWCTWASLTAVTLLAAGTAIGYRWPPRRTRSTVRRERRRRGKPAARRRPQPIPGWGLFVHLRRLPNLRRLGRLPAVEDLPHPPLRQAKPGRQLGYRHTPPVRRPQCRIPPLLVTFPRRPARHGAVQQHRNRQQQPASRVIQPAIHVVPLSSNRHPAHTPPSAEERRLARAHAGRKRRRLARTH